MERSKRPGVVFDKDSLLHWRPKDEREDRLNRTFIKLGAALNQHEWEHGVDNPWDLEFLHLQPSEAREREYLDGKSTDEKIRLLILRERAAYFHLLRGEQEFPIMRSRAELMTLLGNITPKP